MAYQARLESACRFRDRGFESHPLRQKMHKRFIIFTNVIVDYLYMMLFKKQNLKVGLALGSGAARGLAHIGVLKALKEAEIPIDIIAGTSMGAMVGACFAKDGTITTVEETALNTGWKEMARFLDSKIGHIRQGLIYGGRVDNLLQSLIGSIKFNQLKIPFSCITTDINTGERVVITSGLVKDAVRASISIPGIFVPVVVQDKCLVDGGLIDPLPIEALKEMGANVMIAINVLVDPQRSKRSASSSKGSAVPEIPNIFNAILQSLYIMEYEIAKHIILQADLVISPQVSHIEAFDFNRGEEAILTGYKAGKEILPKLRSLINRF